MQDGSIAIIQRATPRAPPYALQFSCIDLEMAGRHDQREQIPLATEKKLSLISSQRDVNDANTLVAERQLKEPCSHVSVYYNFRRRNSGGRSLSSARKRASSRFEMALRKNDWTEIRSGERDEEGHASTFSKAATVSI